ncbi:MAG TPA: DegT/DnrJ/EryC1/StrS family aminotransferase [Verrucomicrobiae bacterium]|jgi:dTDP-4-amino-4,6-dideoxygalactose transaminase
MHVPFLDLRAQNDPLRAEIMAAIGDVIDKSTFAGGPFVSAFEEDFAKFCGSKYAIGLGSGTEALWLVLLALGIGQGDEVITVPSTFMATAEAITYAGATPVFVDIEDQTYTLDPLKLSSAITSRTKAIIPVHLFGQMADMDPIMAVAHEHKLPVIEDACQAHGATYKGRRAGTIGIAGCFSFYPGKNLGAFGEAGAVTTNDAELKKRIEIFRDHGQAKKYFHDAIGWNCRMDGIQGAILRVKLKYLAKGNEMRRAHADQYNRELNQVSEMVTPKEAKYAQHVYHLYPVRVQNRDEVLTGLQKKGVGCAIHYPIPVHLQKAYEQLRKGPGSFPVAEKCANEFLSLPMFPELLPEQVTRVVEELKAEIHALHRKP